jgi:N-acetyl-alpha-D-muramate 1-phosphate uridylyltransferase
VSASPPRTAIVFAAGLGTRMRPLTAETAKPLLPLGGRTLLDRALDRLGEAGVARVVVNAHWQEAGLAAHLRARTTGPETVLLAEERLLGTGETLRRAVERGLLGPGPFFAVNGDAAWFDGPVPALERLAHALDDAACDAVLLLVRATSVAAEINRGDFMLDPAGRPSRPDPSPRDRP